MHVANDGQLSGAIDGVHHSTQLTDTGEDTWTVEGAVYYAHRHYKAWRRDGDGYALIDDTLSVYAPERQVSARASALPPGLRMDDGFVCTLLLLRRQ